MGIEEIYSYLPIKVEKEVVAISAFIDFSVELKSLNLNAINLTFFSSSIIFFDDVIKIFLPSLKSFSSTELLILNNYTVIHYNTTIKNEIATNK